MFPIFSVSTVLVPIILLVVFGACAIAAVLIFSLAVGGGQTNTVGAVKIWGTLDRMTEPLYRPIRKILPDFGGLDLSPLVVLVGLAIIERVLVEVQYSALGM